MNNYFKLQYEMLNRKMDEIGLLPILAYPLAIIGFYGISLYLFSKTAFAEYYYGIIALSFVSKLSEQKRNDFLKTIFSTINYRRLRITENFIIVFPFLLFLIYNESLIVALALIFLSLLLSIFNFNTILNITIPTPFSKQPFEFPIGFRKTFYIFPFAYFLTFQSIFVENFGLGIFSMLLIGLVVLSYYSKPENEYYIWSFNLTSKGFLINKIKTGLLYFTFLSLPVMIALSTFFPDKITILIVFLLLCYTYIVTIILAKYSAYPNEMNLPQGMLVGFSLMFPPMLIGVIPFFYVQSIKQLKPMLEDD